MRQVSASTLEALTGRSREIAHCRDEGRFGHWSDGARPPLVSADDIEWLIDAEVDLAHLRMGKEGMVLPPALYAPDGHADPSRVRELYADGATMVFQHLQALNPRWRDAATGLQNAFGHRIRLNVYVSPPSSQMFRRHTDQTDVLILHQHGRKHWQFDLDSVRRPVTTVAGDVLFMPAETLHKAMSQDSSSVHVTCALMPDGAEFPERPASSRDEVA